MQVRHLGDGGVRDKRHGHGFAGRDVPHEDGWRGYVGHFLARVLAELVLFALRAHAPCGQTESRGARPHPALGGLGGLLLAGGRLRARGRAGDRDGMPRDGGRASQAESGARARASSSSQKEVVGGCLLSAAYSSLLSSGAQLSAPTMPDTNMSPCTPSVDSAATSAPWASTSSANTAALAGTRASRARRNRALPQRCSPRLARLLGLRLAHDREKPA